MSKFGSLSRVAACGFVFAAALLVSSFNASAANSGVTIGQAMVKKVLGSASYTDAAGKGGPVKEGMAFAPGVTITTTPGSTVELDLGDNGEKLLIKSDSTLKIDKLDSTSTGADTVINTQLEIKKGGISGNVKKLSAASKYEVKTSNGVAGIRGTLFAVYSDGRASVWQGTIVVVYIINGVASPPQTVIAGQTVAPPVAAGGQATLVNYVPPPDFTPPPPPATHNQPGTVTILMFISPTTGETEGSQIPPVINLP